MNMITNMRDFYAAQLGATPFVNGPWWGPKSEDLFCPSAISDSCLQEGATFGDPACMFLQGEHQLTTSPAQSLANENLLISLGESAGLLLQAHRAKLEGRNQDYLATLGRAAHEGNAPAQVELAGVLMAGILASKNEQAAVAALEVATGRGNLLALWNLAQVYASKNDDFHYLRCLNQIREAKKFVPVPPAGHDADPNSPFVVSVNPYNVVLYMAGWYESKGNFYDAVSWLKVAESEGSVIAERELYRLKQYNY